MSGTRQSWFSRSHQGAGGSEQGSGKTKTIHFFSQPLLNLVGQVKNRDISPLNHCKKGSQLNMAKVDLSHIVTVMSPWLSSTWGQR